MLVAAARVVDAVDADIPDRHAELRGAAAALAEDVVAPSQGAPRDRQRHAVPDAAVDEGDRFVERNVHRPRRLVRRAPPRLAVRVLSGG